MRRFLLLAAATTAHAQLTEFSSHIVLTGFDVERFNRPDRLAHINLFGLMRVFFDEPDSTYVRYFDRDTRRAPRPTSTTARRAARSPTW